MPYYLNKHILFIHIPKTGGTTIEELFRKNDSERVYSSIGIGDTNRILPPPFDRVSLQHQFYTTILKFKDKLGVVFNDNLRIFSIVRDPYRRIISDMMFLNIVNPDSTSEKVFECMKSYVIADKYDNHNVPQYKFITDKQGNLIPEINIFRNETLNDDMKKFGFEIKQNFQVGKKVDYNKYLNDDSINLINTIYKKDFQLFNYKMREI
tara:strand:- start:559 stop:1182 length:624 start_codon:yes stop_codon:yes gene_type:complete